ncbi:hypothetical protein BDF20DRAFT_837631 [Mycotypha africana]|uniref:uncharacterized protein n=1 Tax=Mycotypha africana TaxID=64632 RepID=UPI002300B399|nr:uncharacterized protein BDF20DRAFT_837631 [Mycotypha africana]KAI8973714.1 hypothetical protein BDF20DRAFT_837631 [Mycotypha africana]
MSCLSAARLRFKRKFDDVLCIELLVSLVAKVIGANRIRFSFRKLNMLYITTWQKHENGSIETSSNPVSLPFGAAVMKNCLTACENDQTKKQKKLSLILLERSAGRNHKWIHFVHEWRRFQSIELFIHDNVFTYYINIARRRERIENKLQEKKFEIYYPDHQWIQHYREAIISIANRDLDKLVDELRVFYSSKRRTRMIPVICFLIFAILKNYKSETSSKKAMYDKIHRTIPRPSSRRRESLRARLTTVEYNTILEIIKGAITLDLMPELPSHLHRLVPSAVHLANLTTHYPKDTHTFIAFEMPLAGGLSTLAYRQGEDAPDPSFHARENMIGKEVVDVCKYVGRLMEMIFSIFPWTQVKRFVGDEVQRLNKPKLFSIKIVRHNN